MRSQLFLTGICLVLAACSSNDSPALNQAPMVESIADQTISANVSSDPVALVLSDDTTGITSLTLQASSDNEALIPSAAVVFEAGSTGRSLVITPSAGMTGSATVVVSVSDERGATVSASFLVTVEQQSVSYKQTLRDVFGDDVNALPRNVNSLNFIQDAEDDTFVDLL